MTRHLDGLRISDGSVISSSLHLGTHYLRPQGYKEPAPP
jgi:hypothetical protein